MKKITINCLAAISALFMLSAVAAAATYVSATGNDLNPGTSAAPCRTIQRALRVTPPGDEVIVGTGDYEPFFITRGAKVRAAGGATPRIRYRLPYPAAVTINTYNFADVVELQGLTLLSPATGGIGIFHQHGGTLTVSGCVIQGFGRGIAVYDRCELNIRDCAVTNDEKACETRESVGIELASPRSNFPISGAIERSKIYGHGYGLTAAGQVWMRISDSVFSDNAHNGVTAQADLTESTNVDLEFERCHISNNREIGLLVRSRPGGETAATVRLSRTEVRHNGFAGVYNVFGAVRNCGGNTILGNPFNVIGSLWPC